MRWFMAAMAILLLEISVKRDALAIVVPDTIVLSSPYFDYKYQNPDLCGVHCFAATYKHSTQPFYTLNSARTIAIQYNSDRHFPKPFVAILATPNSSYGAFTKYWLQAAIAGTALTFTNGETKITYTGSPSASAQRLSAQLDLTGC